MTSVSLVLVGHGSPHDPDATRPVLDLAAAIRGRGRFASVSALFIKPEPVMPNPERLSPSETVVLVPVFAGRGDYTDRVIPKAFRLTGRVTRRDGHRLLITDPVGTHPRLPALLAARAEAVSKAAGVDASQVSLLLLAHGSKRAGSNAGATPKAIAAELARGRRFAEVALAFLEQEPLARDWPNVVHRPEVIALPLLVAPGTHMSRDIPPLFETPPPGTRVHLAQGLGDEPELAEIVIEMAEAILRDF